MRRCLKLSLEALPSEIGRTISLEEEQLLLADAADLASDINQELNEVDRLSDVSNALEDLAAVADQIEQASPTEIALIETAGDVAVAGTDIEAEEVIPSLESYRGKKIATETIRARAATIWKNIQQFLKSVWEKIEKFFYSIFGTIPNTRRRLQKLKEKVDGSHAKSPRGTMFEVSTDSAAEMLSVVNRLMINKRVPRNDSEFMGSLDRLHEMTKYVYGPNIVNRNTLGNEIADAIEQFDAAGDLDRQAERIIAACTDFNRKQKIPGLGSNVPSGSYTLIVGDELIGGGKIVYKEYAQNIQDKSHLGVLERLRHSGMLFEPSGTRGSKPLGKVNLPIVSLNTLSSMIVELGQMLTLLEEYKRSPASRTVDATKKRLENVSKKAAANYDKLDPSAASMQYYKAMVSFNGAYSRWISEPAIPFARYLLSEINALMLYINLCLSTYK